MEKELYFAGGCFWGVSRLFSLIRGVKDAICGYANGHTVAPAYEDVYTDSTGHAETVRVTYDPEVVSTGDLVRVFFASIDPLSRNRQGGDVGTRYRTGVYYTDEADRELIGPIFGSVSLSLGAPVVTELGPLECFYEAEERHQGYLEKNPGGYCHISPKSFRYLALCQDLKALLGDETDTTARMANAAAMIHFRMKFFWTGFYIACGEELVLGPFQGPEACFRIRKGKGVCGAAWARNEVIVVPDVESFPGHISCSSLSRSEIVIPLHSGDGSISAVLDIDSDRIGNFDEDDARWLRLLVEII